MKEMIRRILDNNPLVMRRLCRMRGALRNKQPSFLCPNCIGGILFHDLGIQFRSPTVNLMMTQTDFAKFVLDMDAYLQKDLEFFHTKEYDCPCARLGDITIHFTHYHTREEAAAKWKERAGRLDRENLFVFLTERDGLTKEMMLRLGGIHARGLVIFTARDYPDIPYAVQLPAYQNGAEVGNILRKSWLTGKREYEDAFDFVKWFNEADGKPFSCVPFLK